MKEFLKKLKLIDHLTTILRLSRQDFTAKLSLVTDRGTPSFFSDPFEMFSSSKNEFKGLINYDGFKLKRRRRFFDTNFNMAVATGIVKEEDGQLTIQTEINGFNNFMYVFYGFILVVYSIFIITIIFSDADSFVYAFPFLLLHGTLMSLIPYIIMRRSVKRMKYELEREFFYLTKGN